MNSKNITIKWRLYFIFAIFVFIAVIIEARLYYLQIVKHDEYVDIADRQYSKGVRKLFDRGSIYFTSKNDSEIAAATLKMGYNVAINPSIIMSPEDVYNNLSFDLELNVEDFLSRAEKANDPYEELAKRIEPELGEKIKEKKLMGVSVEKEKWRFYPGKSLASHVVGFLAFDQENKYRGQYGLERYYDETLDRTDVQVFKNFFVEIFSNLKNIIASDNTNKGSIYLTIEPVAQGFVESELENLNKKYSPKKVGAIVMNPMNGEITAMALNPTFDLNEFTKVESSTVFQNNLVESVYELGSIMKPITMAIGLDQGVVTAASTYNDKGSITMDGYTFSNYDKKARGIVNMQEVLNQSLNTGVAHVVSLLGKTFPEKMKNIFGNKTGIDLPNEVSNIIRNLDSHVAIEYATASFGQGVAVSPISMVTALSALGNGGKIVQPHVVKKIEYQSGFLKEVPVREPVQIFKKETSEEISRMLTRVVDEALRKGEVALPQYSIAAKTGTAQIPQPGGGYYSDRYLHSFFGYFPSYDPKFIVFLYIIEPRGAEYASETLTDSFMNITKFLINYYEIPPDRESVVK